MKDQNEPQTADTAALAVLLEGISAMLTGFGEKRWAAWLAEDARRLRGGDPAAIAQRLGARANSGPGKRLKERSCRY